MPQIEEIHEDADGVALPEDQSIAIIDSREDGEDDDDLAETLSERLIGLTEMFPEVVRNAVYSGTTGAVKGTVWLWFASRSVLWVATSSAAILALPIMFERERATMEEQQIQQQRQILLGPNAATTGNKPLIPGAR